MELKLAASTDADNPVENDLFLSPEGDLVWETDLATETAQRLRVKLAFFKGEWFLDQNQGTPYFQNILVKNPDFQVLNAIFRKIFLGTNGVVSVLSLNLSLDSASRNLSLAFELRLQDSSVLRSTDYLPFIVSF